MKLGLPQVDESAIALACCEVRRGIKGEKRGHSIPLLVRTVDKIRALWFISWETDWRSQRRGQAVLLVTRQLVRLQHRQMPPALDQRLYLDLTH